VSPPLYPPPLGPPCLRFHPICPPLAFHPYAFSLFFLLLATNHPAMQNLEQKLSYVTNLKPEYAKQCLERNGNDYAKALSNFYELQVHLFHCPMLWLFTD